MLDLKQEQEKNSESKEYKLCNALMGRESDYDNDVLDPAEEYFRKKKKGNDQDTFFPP